MRLFFKQTIVLTALAASCAAHQAHAGLFDDDEARRAILDIRNRIESVQRELASRIDAKADKASSLDLSGQNEQLRQEVAKLRGQVEVLANEVANAQQRQKDFYADLDTRLRKLEPRPATVDGREVTIEPAEQSAYDGALAAFKSGDYRTSGAAFTDFLRRYPQSGYA